MKRYWAELVGTFCLVFCGTGAIVVNEATNGTIGHLGIALSFGMIVTIMIYAIGEISGAHINPAVSIVLFANKQLNFKDLAFYILFQLTGAILASTMLYLMYPTSKNLGTTLPNGSEMQSFFVEIFLSCMLMFVIEQVKTNKALAGILIGLVVALEALFAGPITGASMNPARSLAPALVSGHFQSLWIYLSAPVIGMFLGSKLGHYFASERNRN